MNKKQCDFELLYTNDSGVVYRCSRRLCGRLIVTPTPQERIFCTCKNQHPGLGDRVAGVLASAGITKQRVSKALGRPCRCNQRQAALNKFGRKIGL